MVQRDSAQGRAAQYSAGFILHTLPTSVFKTRHKKNRYDAHTKMGRMAAAGAWLLWTLITTYDAMPALAMASACTGMGGPFPSKSAAVTAIHCQLFGEEERWTVWPRVFAPPDGVQVGVMVMIEKITIDTPAQTATIKWWLRQNWKDPRLAWDLETYRYGKDGQTGTVQQIYRPGGRTGGTWVPDLMLWESHFEGASSNANLDEATMMKISHDGSVFWSIPQQVIINMVPRMILNNFPFDKQTVKFTIGPWIRSVVDQNTTFPGNDPDEFIKLLGQEGANDEGSTYDDIHTNQYIATEEWSFVEKTAVRRLEKFPCCKEEYATLVGKVVLRRESHFYVKFGVLPQILMTGLGYMCGALRGYTVSAVSFIAGTGFTIALALVAHGVFFVPFIPVLRSTSFNEFVFLYSLIFSVCGTFWTLYLLKKVEHFEEHFDAAEQAELQRDPRKFLRRNAWERQEVRFFFWLDQWLIPSLWLAYVLGMIIAAAVLGANLWIEFSIEIVVMLLISMLVIFASWYDMEKSSDMKNLPHSDYIAYRRSKGRGGFGDGLTRLRRSVFGRILKCFRADEAKELSAPADSRQDVLQTNNAAAHDHAPAIATNPKMAMGLRLAHSDLVQLAPTAGYAGHI